MTLSKLNHYLFYLILFLLPTNLAKHFPLPSAHVSGHLIDYLIPTIYLTDLLIFVLILPQLSTLKLKPPHLLLIASLLPATFFAFSPIPAAYKLLKLILLIFFSLWIKQNINLKTQLKSILLTLNLSAIFQSIIALLQWSQQSSIATYLFLGEQPYNQSTPNIDNITWFNGSIKIPPLATFPHPNILAGFLCLIIPLALYQLIKSKKTTVKLFYLASLILQLLALFLTFSLSAWLALLLLGLPLTIIFVQSPNFIDSNRFQQLSLIKNLPRFQHWQNAIQAPDQPLSQPQKLNLLKFFLMLFGLTLIILAVFKNLPFLTTDSSFTRRSQLTQIAVKAFKTKPISGVGLNNFTVTMEQFGYIVSTTRFLQPVHNIYLLIVSETGLIGLIGWLIFIFSPLINSIKTKQFNPFIIPYLSLLFIGLFDHYPFTIQQGLLAFFLLHPLQNLNPQHL